MTLVEKAEIFASAAHAAIGQVRKYTGAPYRTHLAAVASLVGTVTDDAEMLAAAWLHDTVEDTRITFADIERVFGFRVTALVRDLTDVSRPEDGNRRARKALDRQHTAAAHPDAKTIKLADLIDNTRSIVARDRQFSKVYLGEKELLLPMLIEGDSRLWAWASSMAKGTPEPELVKALERIDVLCGSDPLLRHSSR